MIFKRHLLFSFDIFPSMKKTLCLLKVALISIIIVFSQSCKKKDDVKKNDPNTSVMVSQANGFEYVGAFEENQYPYYEFPAVFHIDDYQNNDRVLVMTQNAKNNPPRRIRWYILNYQNGVITQSYYPNDGFGTDWGNNMIFTFDHENFKLQSWHTIDRYFYQVDPDTKRTSYVIANGTSTNYVPPKIIKNYLLRGISEISIWPYNTLSQQDEPQYLLTGELSAMQVVDYFIEEANYESQKANSIYTGYFYPTLAGNWIGVGQGSKSLDTLLISNGAPSNYNLGLCKTYIEKVGNKLYLAFIKNKATSLYGDQDLSMYELTIGENILRPLFVNMDLPPDENFEIKALRNGKLIFYPTANAADPTPYTISSLGIKETFSLPVLNNASIQRHIFGKKYLYLTLSNSGGEKRLEFYKKDLFK